MLASPQSLMSMTRAGPFMKTRQSSKRFPILARHDCLVCTSDEMVINETLDLYERLGSGERWTGVLNECMPLR